MRLRPHLKMAYKYHLDPLPVGPSGNPKIQTAPIAKTHTLAVSVLPNRIIPLSCIMLLRQADSQDIIHHLHPNLH